MRWDPARGDQDQVAGKARRHTRRNCGHHGGGTGRSTAEPGLAAVTLGILDGRRIVAAPVSTAAKFASTAGPARRLFTS